VAGLTTEHDEVVARIAALRARIQRVPQREQELAGLTRDYEALKERHRGMLAKLYQADLSRKVAREQGDERLRVLDPAVPPAVPVRPRRLLIAVAGLVLAAGAAVGVACLVDRVVDTSFHNARVVEDVLELPVVAVIPVIGAGRRVQA
jgi:succinoglycan biosynthesis transport protein ExoP